jgi:TonB family protein
METVGQPPAEAELHLLTDWSDPDARSRHCKAAAGAIGINVAIVLAIGLLPESFFRPPELPESVQRVTPLMMPLPELTQRDPNPGKARKEFEVQAPQAPRRAIQMPPSPPPLKGEEAPKLAPPPPLPEPPKVDAARETLPADLLRAAQQTTPPPQPQIQTVEKPSLTFENPPPPRSTPVPIEQRRIPLPTEALNNIAREAAGGGSPVGTVVGDAGAWGSAYNGMSQSSAPGNPLAAVQLRSDTEGVDFKPYLMQLIATIKRNWLAVIPESARMGRRGKVSLQFVIAKDGNIDKIVFAEQSGSSALDRAAVSGVSASNPLPPLPREYKGTRIVLQLNFVYR